MIFTISANFFCFVVVECFLIYFLYANSVWSLCMKVNATSLLDLVFVLVDSLVYLNAKICVASMLLHDVRRVYNSQLVPD